VQPKAILETYKRGDRAEVIASNADYIAMTRGSRSFPWRVMVVASEDRELLENELVYKLSSPCLLAETDWIRPGKVAWDWWNANNIYGVDFRAGINTETYKYYIDFASEFGLEYVILDEGWSASTLDLSTGNPELNIEELFAYAENKDVGIILWVLWNALDKDLEATLDRFAGWGARGIKVDFMVRADQDMVNYYERVAAEAAKRELLVNYHGAYKPSGLNRKYPNVVNYEGVKGLENSKWEEAVSPWHDVVLPFTRMVAGPMDYTPGAMINANKENFRAVFTQPMSQGTRAHQAAMYVLYDAPLQMLCDNPSNYLKEPEYTRFLAEIPVSWDQTIGLPSRVGEYVVMARRQGDVWYLGAMTNWDTRTLEIDPSFLGNGTFQIDYLEDGPNADRHAADYRMSTRTLQPGEKISIKMAPGGGWVAILKPVP
jgi:alpha-glucosidase